ncbi:Csu type fimbrial protein [Methylovirgula sp. 4M-Z18]|uniref:Csu type fimbrial protein n=1 Tax=Methylovirgula sp. 4M-Z18 TaxID=2293567 RepID=UPI000E2EA587|nr:spore coat U domain-containing protein [Methylovirgula sp. 4M-Z18]RFB79441.1 spore coat U domain-containing protein [Methylovirgula sp. 4M-Z18]
MSMMRTLRLCLLSLLAFAGMFLAPRPTHALTLACNVTVTQENFGTVDVLPGAAINTNASLTVDCGITALQANIYMCITFPAYSMQGSGGSVAWQLDDPTTPSNVWSSTTPIVVPAVALSLDQKVTINLPATMFGGQSSVPSGTYTQSLTGSATWSTTSCTSHDILSSGTTTANVSAQVIVQKSCNISATNLNFGSVGDLTTVHTGQSSLSVQCTKSTGYTIGLNGGNSGATDPTARSMTAGSNSIRYGLYQQSGGSTPWGNTSSNWLSGTGTAATQTIPVYGVVPIQTTPPPNTYQDTIIATVTY